MIVNAATAAPIAAWRVLGESVRGANHIRQGLPNQDAIASYVDADTGINIVAVADGHGSARSSRSDRGARFAVSAAVAVIQEALTSANESLPARLSTAVLRRWKKSVREDAAGDPLPGKPKADQLYLAYGSTVAAVGISSERLIALNLGDGDILQMSATGEVRRYFLQPVQLGEETESLCTPGASSRMDVTIVDNAPSLPALILLCTDGYSKSFETDRGFRQAGEDFSRLIRAEGADFVRANLARWLKESTELGSGDDVTVALLIRGVQ